MLRFIQEVNTTSRYCALWDLEDDTDYTVHVQAISMRGPSPPSTPLHFHTPKEAEKQASKTKGESKVHSSAVHGNIKAVTSSPSNTARLRQHVPSQTH